MNGARGGVRDESGKHGKDTGVAGRRHKGESGGGFAPGARRFYNWGGSERMRNHRRWRGGLHSAKVPHTVFVDNLPRDVTKRAMYKEFGKDGYISDIFVSRKVRRNSTGAFAFIRFISYEATVKALKRLNGTRWKETNLYVGLSKSCKGYGWGKVSHYSHKQPMKPQKSSTKWVVVKCQTTKKQRLQRSLHGVSVKPIEFRKIMDHLLDEWKGPGKIECRDVGPYRCLLTFDSPEIRDNALQCELLRSTFDETRMHWDIFWCLSRSVWIEVLGMPICLWSKENFTKIAELWGKVIEFDHRAGEAKSYSTAKILLDCFQWEGVHEWVSIRVNDSVFEVFATNPESIVRETPVEDEGTPTSLSIGNVCDPQLEAIIDCNLDTVNTFNFDSGSGSRCIGNRFIGIESGVDCGSCPYPPGFGPCSDRTHVHHELARVKEFPQFVNVVSNEVERNGVDLSPLVPVPVTDQDIGAVQSGTNLSPEDSRYSLEGSEETLYRINDGGWCGLKGILDTGVEAGGDLTCLRGFERHNSNKANTDQNGVCPVEPCDGNKGNNDGEKGCNDRFKVLNATESRS
ncbi:hypothetical protein PIB30_014795 [Stylosanthes scabra]|uniref:RRM domain-containing protein n=1 Tax=Stylosanthes scabra TaxID=79078 RepID=A0ABU6Z8K0_9FABA|nr:hypothetical protein [Stylosanthes scabra]